MCVTDEMILPYVRNFISEGFVLKEKKKKSILRKNRCVFYNLSNFKKARLFPRFFLSIADILQHTLKDRVPTYVSFLFCLFFLMVNKDLSSKKLQNRLVFKAMSQLLKNFILLLNFGQFADQQRLHSKQH